MKSIILIISSVSLQAAAAIHTDRLKEEMDFLRRNAFKDSPSKELLKTSNAPAEDLDEIYFSDSVSTNMAAPEKSKAKMIRKRERKN